MIKIKMAGKDWLILIFFYLLLFQNPLELVLPALKYIDECAALIGPAMILMQAIRNGKLKLKKEDLKIIIPLLVFLLAGVSGNILYDYQETTSVLIDLFTNLKFFFCILTGYTLYLYFEDIHCNRLFVAHARFAAGVLAMLVFVDLIFQLFPSPGERYGMRIIQLFYGHATYLAGSATFLLATLTMFYEKRNNPYIILSAIVCVFTLRGKAIATVAVYFLVCFMIMRPKRKLKIWHVAVIGALALVVAWEQLSYYYIELEGTSARSALTIASFEIATDYFPIGTGFGTFASAEASKNYSPVYYLYDLSKIYGLSEDYLSFGSDTFWPIIIGQTGFIGTACYISVLINIFRRILKTYSMNIYVYTSGIFMFAYFAVSSTSEPTFCNVVSIPLAALIGFAFAMEKTSARYRKVSDIMPKI